MGEGNEIYLVYQSPTRDTCCKADLHSPLSVPKHLKLGKRHLVGHPHRIRALVPFIPDISHGVTDCNHKPVPAADFAILRSRSNKKRVTHRKKKKKVGGGKKLGRKIGDFGYLWSG